MIENHPIQRVAVLSVHTCPLAMLGGKKTGGMNVYVRDFCRELDKQGIMVDVFTRSQDDCVPKVVHALGDYGRVIHIPAGPERPLPVPEVADYLDEFVAGVQQFAMIDDIDYDVIHSHYWLSGLVAHKLREQWGGTTPIVHMFHTLGHMKNKIAIDDRHRAPQSRIDGEMDVIHHVADVLIAATPAEEQQLIELYGADPAKIEVVSPGVDLNRFSYIPRQEAKITVGLDKCKQNILFAGRIEPLKGIDTLLTAVGFVQERCPNTLENVCVTIVGGDPKEDSLDTEMGRLQELCKQLDLENLVTFVGSKDQMILPNYYAASEIVVMPSHYESFGLVALEAMAMGTPVIASEVGGLAHLVKNGVTGYHIPSRDAQALAQRIFDLLEDHEGRDAMGDCARAYSRLYAWSRVVKKMLGIYRRLLATDGGSVEATAPMLPCAMSM
ncbi:MAG: glycosyltransferase [Candidatus Promineifilaceae bacterium]